MLSHLKVLVSVVLLLGVSVSLVSAEPVDDPRMSVWVGAKSGSYLSVPKAIGQALPILWDRILLQSSRHLVSDKMNATSFLLRATAKSDGVYIEFNAARVWQYLERKEIAFIREPLRARVLIKILNQHGLSMSESTVLLQQKVARLTKNLGIVLDAQAPPLVLSWRWLDNQQFQLTMRGHPKVPEHRESRAFMGGDSQVQLTAWLQEVLLQARDVSILDFVGAETVMVKNDAPLQLLLTIRRHAALPEQIGLEEALRQHPQVVVLTAKYLSVENQQYHLQLKDQYDDWLSAWLSRYGLQSMKTPTGWVAQ